MFVKYLKTEVLKRMTGHVACMTETSIKVWLENLKTQFGRHMRRSEDNIKTDVKVIGREGVDWIHLEEASDQCRALMNTVISL
jgi:hypothetical protein